MPWKEHSPSKPSSFAPLDTSIWYELAHKQLAHLLHATIDVSLYQRKMEENLSLIKKM
jgi:hypothetical protein